MTPYSCQHLLLLRMETETHAEDPITHKDPYIASIVRQDPGDLGLKAIRVHDNCGPLFWTPMDPLDPFRPIKT